jgi:hypothetical protein
MLEESYILQEGQTIDDMRQAMLAKMRDMDCLERVPPKNKCFVEPLFEYRLDGIFHSLDYHED